MKLCKLLLAVVGATVLLGALVSSASANRLSASTQSFTAHWTNAEFKGGFGNVVCSLTLEGSLHSRTISKVVGALIGFITRASVGPCQTGTATVLLATLPWHVRYAGFTGTLPIINSEITNVIGAAWQVREPIFGVTCLATSSTSSPATGTYTLTGGAVTRVSLGGRINTNCGLNGELVGNSSSNSELTITLI